MIQNIRLCDRFTQIIANKYSTNQLEVSNICLCERFTQIFVIDSPTMTPIEIKMTQHNGVELYYVYTFNSRTNNVFTESYGLFTDKEV